MVTRVFLSAVTRIPMSLEERLGVGFVENGKLRIAHWRIAMSVRGQNFLQLARISNGLGWGARCFQMTTEAFPGKGRG
jgi:hypothetical protein